MARMSRRNRSRRAICSSRAGSVPVATSTLRRCARIAFWCSASSSAWVSSRRPAAMSASTVATGALASQRSAVPGGSVAVNACFNGRRAGWVAPFGSVNSSRSRSSRRQSGHWPGCGLVPQAAQSGNAGTVQFWQIGSLRVPDGSARGVRSGRIVLTVADMAGTTAARSAGTSRMAAAVRRSSTPTSPVAGRLDRAARPACGC